jgi:hypothetical protein
MGRADTEIEESAERRTVANIMVEKLKFREELGCDL